jgi:hypothetical protein
VERRYDTRLGATREPPIWLDWLITVIGLPYKRLLKPITDCRICSAFAFYTFLVLASSSIRQTSNTQWASQSLLFLDPLIPPSFVFKFILHFQSYFALHRCLQSKDTTDFVLSGAHRLGTHLERLYLSIGIPSAFWIREFILSLDIVIVDWKAIWPSVIDPLCWTPLWGFPTPATRWIRSACSFIQRVSDDRAIVIDLQDLILVQVCRFWSLLVDIQEKRCCYIPKNGDNPHRIEACVSDSTVRHFSNHLDNYPVSHGMGQSAAIHCSFPPRTCMLNFSWHSTTPNNVCRPDWAIAGAPASSACLKHRPSHTLERLAWL